MRVTLDYTKTVHQNADAYFAKAKKAKKKLEGVDVALKLSEKKIAELKKKRDDYALTLEPEKDESNRKTHWYEQFRWFHTSSGKLAVGGRNATSNEQVLKSHVLAHDLVFHTEAPGSPFFVLQTEGTDVHPLELEEVGQLTAAYSKAWAGGYTSVEAFYVNPDQVSKHAQSGEYVKKGSFMVRGKKTFVQPRMELYVGLLENGQIVTGSSQSVKRQTKKFAKIVPGREKSSDIAKQLKKKLGGGNLDELIRMIPSGGSRVSK
jgi:predicted ribosome quality control (RQC) complex YloA/Tae2 family protein